VVGVSSADFASLGLRPELLHALAELGYEEPTGIQEATIPALISGSDVLGQAATGTGKTAAFSLPMLQVLDKPERGRAPVGLVLVPTRELALQVSEALRRYGRTLGVRLVTVYGGAPVRQQIDTLKRGVDIVVATPGRALDLISRKSLDLREIRTVVLDEADEMLDMGFIEDIEAILASTPSTRQTVLFSATLPARIGALARKHLTDPVRITITPEKQSKATAERVRQVAYNVTRSHKSAALLRILDAEEPGATIIFCRTRGGVDELTDRLAARGYQAEGLHGGLTQDQRDRVMGRLRAKTTDVLVATDVAARGLDVDHLTHVVNYDLPASPEAYVHRIGRVGRAGREGVALSLVEPRERKMLSLIEKLVGHRIVIEKIPTMDTVREARLQRTRSEVEAILADDDARGRLEPYRSVLNELLDSHDPMQIALAGIALVHEAQRSPVEEDDAVFEAPAAETRSTAKSAGRSKGPERKTGKRLDGPAATLFVSVGRKAGVTPGDLVGAITGESGLKGRDIGAITVHDRYSLVEVPKARANEVVGAMRSCAIRGQRVQVRMDRDKRRHGK
jgi:ATP-dependent RNA helicase DeaD